MAPTSATERAIVTHGAPETRALGASLAAVAAAGDLICLVGDLGAGKTQLAKGFGAGLGVIDPIVSPSFILMAEYEGRLPLFHLDLYRLDGAATALEDGLLDERERAGVTIVEWAERLGAALPPGHLEIVLDGAGDEPRLLVLRATDGRHARLLEAVA